MFNVTSYKLQVSGFKFQVSSFRFQVSSFRFQVSSFRFQVTYPLGTGVQKFVTFNFERETLNTHLL